MKDGVGCGQHGEDRLLRMFFGTQASGLLVDVGAADGFMNSNSVGLLKRLGWEGILIEPETSQFAELRARYTGWARVTCVNAAIGRAHGTRTLYAGGQVSTFDEDVKRAAEDVHKIAYTEQQVRMLTLTEVLQRYFPAREIDFLTIDAEGMNYDVWLALDKQLYSPRLVCIEGKGYRMNGYVQLCRCGCNTFYVRDDQCLNL